MTSRSMYDEERDGGKPAPSASLLTRPAGEIILACDARVGAGEMVVRPLPPKGEREARTLIRVGPGPYRQILEMWRA